MKEQIRKHRNLITNLCLLLLTLIAGIYLSLFTNSDYLKDFWGIKLSALGDLWFMLAFGLIAGIALFKAVVALGIIIAIGILSTFIMYLTYIGYEYLLKLFGWSSRLIVLVILTVLEFGLALSLWYAFPSENPVDAISLTKSLISLLILLLGVVNLKFFAIEIEKRKMKKDYNIEKIDKDMVRKWLFGLLITVLLLGGLWASFTLADKFAKIADLKYIEIIITTAVFLSGFGLFAMDKKESVYFVNVKIIIVTSILSIISSFLYIIIENEVWKNAFFKIASGSLFATITLILILTLFHDNKYMLEIEKSKS